MRTVHDILASESNAAWIATRKAQASHLRDDHYAAIELHDKAILAYAMIDHVPDFGTALGREGASAGEQIRSHNSAIAVHETDMYASANETQLQALIVRKIMATLHTDVVRASVLVLREILSDAMDLTPAERRLYDAIKTLSPLIDAEVGSPAAEDASSQD